MVLGPAQARERRHENAIGQIKIADANRIEQRRHAYKLQSEELFV
jgi:hypothetical protein